MLSMASGTFVMMPLAMLLLCFVPQTIEDWPYFRGPGRQGHSTEKGLSLRWSATENIAWKTPIPGESWSSPIVWKDHVFMTTTTDGGVSCRVLALDFATGKLLWNTEVFQQKPKRKEGRNSYATPTPATEGKRIYAVFGEGSVAAVDFTGKLVWTNREFPFYSQHGLGSSPLLTDGLLIMSYDGSSEGPDKVLGWQKPWDQSFLAAFDLETGRVKWKTMRGLSRISHGTPTVHTGTDGR